MRYLVKQAAYAVENRPHADAPTSASPGDVLGLLHNLFLGDRTPEAAHDFRVRRHLYIEINVARL